jgi:hypothetical protein
MHAGGVPHIVEKLSTRVTMFLWTSIWPSKFLGVPILEISKFPT